MTHSKDSPPGAQSLPRSESLASPLRDEKDESSAKSRGKVSALLVGVDDEIEQLRLGMQQILADEAAPESPTRSGEVLQALVSTLREANEHLLIASLDADRRETNTAEAHRRQTLFLSMLAHELRNPLAPIAMSVELLGKSPGLTPAMQSLQSIMARQTTHLTRLVEDLMDATRISGGKMKLRKSALLMSQVLTQALEISQPLLDAHRQTVSLHIDLESVRIHGDLVRLTQLFSNLIINASKFSADDTPVCISAWLEADHVVVAIKDEGIGIAPELQPYVFDLFTQGPVATGLMANGLGIGLSLAQTIARLHEGTIVLHSLGVGRGCEFTVTLPVAVGVAGVMPVPAPTSPTVLASEPRELQPRRILLIDDNEDINATLGQFLREAGHGVDTALDGLTGLRLDDLHHYDVICCDIGLPDMSGYEVAERLQQGPSTACLIAISGYDQSAQRARALVAGFDHYLVKPIWGQDLLELIDLQECKAGRV